MTSSPKSEEDSAFVSVLLTLHSLSKFELPIRLPYFTETSPDKELRERALRRLVLESAIGKYIARDNHWKIELTPTFDKLFDRYSVQTKRGTEVVVPNANTTLRSHYVARNELGDYYWRGRLIEISKTSLPYNAFDIVFQASNNGGLVKYESIEAELVRRGVKSEPDRLKSIKRINNSLVNRRQGFLRYARVGSKSMGEVLKAVVSFELIKVEPGSGLRINNPIL